MFFIKWIRIEPNSNQGQLEPTFNPYQSTRDLAQLIQIIEEIVIVKKKRKKRIIGDEEKEHWYNKMVQTEPSLS